MHSIHKHRPLTHYDKQTRQCKNCGDSFEVRTVNKRTGGLARGATKQYCSGACRQEAYRARKIQEAVDAR